MTERKRGSSAAPSSGNADSDNIELSGAKAVNGSPPVASTEASRVQWGFDGVLIRPDDIVLWRRLAVAEWISAAGRRGLYAQDITYDVLDWCRDDDDEYAGTVRVGDDLLDLVADGESVRVCAEGRYCP